LALEREMDRFRPYLGLSPDEAEARAAAAPPTEKPLLEQFDRGWGPIEMYFRLSPNDFAALRAGQALSFRTPPQPGERPVPADLMDAMLRRQRADLARALNSGAHIPTEASRPGSGPAASTPQEWGKVDLWIHQSELGQLTFEGIFGAHIITDPRRPFGSQGSGSIAVGLSPAAVAPNNAVANARFARDPTLQTRVAVQPQSSCHGELSPSPSPTRGGVPVVRGSDTRNQEPRPSPLGRSSPSRGGGGAPKARFGGPGPGQIDADGKAESSRSSARAPPHLRFHVHLGSSVLW